MRAAHHGKKEADADERDWITRTHAVKHAGQESREHEDDSKAENESNPGEHHALSKNELTNLT